MSTSLQSTVKKVSCPYYQVDAFITDSPFSGNPAGVCLLNKWPTDAVLQSMAAEHNQAETAFIVEKEDQYELRWFTPLVEVELCGHATLASAHVIMSLYSELREVHFQTKSGKLTVTKANDTLLMNLPVNHLTKIENSAELTKLTQLLEIALGHRPAEIWKSNFLVAVFKDETIIQSLQPKLDIIAKLDCFGLIVTSESSKETVDFVSRFFGPQVGIDEDPVTGAAHCALAPLWEEKLLKTPLTAMQLSPRRGFLRCWTKNDRTFLSGKASSYFSGSVWVPYNVTVDSANLADEVTITEVEEADLNDWVSLRDELFPLYSTSAHWKEMRMILQDKYQTAFLAKHPKYGSIGFIEIALYAKNEKDCKKNLAELNTLAQYAHIEAWFVKAEFRNKMIGRELMEQAELWALHRGIRQFHSDTDYFHGVRAHRSAGYKKLYELAIFTKEK